MSDQPTVGFSSPPTDGGRHRRWIPAVIAVLAVLVVALPLAVLLLVRGTERAGPAPSPSATASSSRSTSPAPSGSSSPSPTTPDGRISLATLRNATVDLPPWPTDNVRGPSGRIHLHDGRAVLTPRASRTGQAPYGTEIVLLSVAYGDVDRDGAAETVAEFGCVIEGGSQQVVALDRDRAGRIVTLGRVVATTGEIRDIDPGSARVSGSGTVTVRVSDYQGCCDDQTPRRTQQRGYRLAAGRFSQTSGPLRMPLNPYVTETSLSTGALQLGPPVDGYRYGTLDVTAVHLRGTAPAHLTLTFYLPAGLQTWGTRWPATTTPGETVSVTVGAPPAHGRTTYSFGFRRATALTGGSVEVGSRASTARVAWLSETLPWDNDATAPVRVVD